MNSIISPWVFYWISVSDMLRRLMLIGVFVGLTVLVFSFCVDEDGSSICSKDERRVRKVGIFLASLCLICVVFLPSEDTCYKMLAANMFTEKNVTAATKYVTDVIDYATDKVKELQPNSVGGESDGK